MLNFKRILITGLFIAIVFPAYSEIERDLSDSFENAVMSWINEEMTEERTIVELNMLDSKLNQLINEKDMLYWKAKTALLRGQILFQLEQPEESIIELEKSKVLAMDAMEFEETDDLWRIISDAGSIIMLQKGVGYIIANSGKVQEQAEKALEMNPDNARAGLIVAQGLMNAPALFGGNKRKGLEQLQMLSKRTDLSEEDRYFIMMSLSDAYILMKKNNDAIRNYRMILAFYPGNGLALSRMNDIK